MSWTFNADDYMLCLNCGEATASPVGTDFCSTKCQEEYNSPEKRLERAIPKRIEYAQNEIKKAEQELRILEFFKNHKPIYTPPSDSIVFTWVVRKFYSSEDKEYLDFEFFLGRWQKDKIFCFGKTQYNKYHFHPQDAYFLLELEQVMHEGKVYPVYNPQQEVFPSYFIRDNHGNIVRWEDFLYLAIQSLINETPQEGLGDPIPIMFGKMHHYRFAGGLNP